MMLTCQLHRTEAHLSVTVEGRFTIAGIICECLLDRMARWMRACNLPHEHRV